MSKMSPTDRDGQPVHPGEYRRRPGWRPSRHLEKTAEGPYLVDCSNTACADPTHLGAGIKESAEYLDSKE